MSRKKLGFWFQVPAMVLLVASVIGSFYAKIANLATIGWSTPITLLIITVLFFLGRKYENSDFF